jgi:alkylhydroperoxidase family enzyme
MPVLRQVPRAEAKAEIVTRMYDLLFGDRDPVAQPGTATGTPGDWWTVFALAPDILKHAVDGFAVYRHPERKIDPVLRELGQTRAGWVRGSQFVFSQHCKSLRGLGVSEERIAAVPYWTVSDVYSDQERAVLAYADCLCQAGGRVPPQVFDKLRTFWNDEEIFEFTYITCLYDMHAVIARALRLEFDDRDDPIVEVAAPKDFKATDFLSARPPSPPGEGKTA